MKLTAVHVKNYRSVDDSTEFAIEPDVTCLVGKNESGKTAVLRGLWLLNPSDPARPNHEIDYPRRTHAKYKARHATSPDVLVHARFQLDDADVAAVEATFGTGSLVQRSISVRRDYQNTLVADIAVDERAVIRHLVASVRDLDPRAVEAAGAAESVMELRARIADLSDTGPSVQALLQVVAPMSSEPVGKLTWDRVLLARMPKFLYFGDYDIMKGAAALHMLADENSRRAEPGLRTLFDLLTLAGVAPESLQPNAQGFETFQSTLESTANSISDEVFEFWSQNKNLTVQLAVQIASAQDAPLPQGAPILRLRIYNQNHRASVAFDERSRGFVWFFSFLARFNRISPNAPTILLLDEPGLSLHASAQADFLKFINERLAPHHQVVYTTHSPFMVEADRLNRVRTVEDAPSKGTVVSAEVLRTDAATTFPLQAALGYSMAQTLFIGPNSLLVEGPSDLLYLQLMSERVRASGGQPLDPAWVIVPVGGADRLAAFVSLLGSNRINVAVLMDVAQKDQQRVDSLIRTGFLDSARILRLSEFAEAGGADIEDLFDSADYLELVHLAHDVRLEEAELPPGKRIVKRVEAALAAKGVSGFNHFRPAQQALRGLTEPSTASVRRFANLFNRLNALVAR